MFFIWNLLLTYIKRQPFLRTERKERKATKFCFKLDLFSEVERKCETNTVKEGTTTKVKVQNRKRHTLKRHRYE
jgi:hypothetical protein